MSKMTTGKFWWLKHLLLALAFFAALLIAATFYLRHVTKHNQEIAVPDFSGMTVTQARRAASQAGVRVDVIDSIYVKRVPRGSVVRQEPKAGQMVKEDRRILLTINAVTPKKVIMPNLVGYSLRSANAELASRGLRLGRLIYVKDMATNNVLSQLYHNSEIAPGTKLSSESRIDLVLGLSPEDNMTSAPNLYGQRYRAALDEIHESSLNIGKVGFDRGIRSYQDSLNAVVYRQVPEPHEPMKMGQTLSVYFTLDENKVPVYDPMSKEEQ